MLSIAIIAMTATTSDLPSLDLASASLGLNLSSALAAQEPSGASGTWGAKDTWRWGVSAGYGWDVKESDNQVAIAGIEFDCFLEDHLSLNLGFNGLSADQVGTSAGGFNFTLQLRWHVHVEQDWSFFVEGGAGLLWTDSDVPSGGSDFNFTPQAGAGFSVDTGEGNRWLIGVRWHHISNANIYDTNPGRDSLMAWTGMTFPF